MNKEKKIDKFLGYLREKSPQDLGIHDGESVGDLLKHFSVLCKKCGSNDIFVSWEEGTDYGGYTGYSSGQKLFKCNGCGNAASFWE